MAYRFLDLLESEYKEDVSSIKDQLKTKYEKTHEILKEAFSGEYTSKECALDRIQKDFLNEKIAPKSIDASWLKTNMDYVVSTLQSLTEGDIKIIINNGDSGKASTIGYELEGKKRPGRPAASAAVVAPVTAVAPTTVPGTDKTTQEPLVENPPDCKKNEATKILPGCKVGDMVTVNDKEYVVDGMEDDIVYASDEDGKEFEFQKNEIEKVTECAMKTEDDAEADAEDRIPGHEAGESDEEERAEHGQQEEPMAEINTEKRPLKWSEIEAAMTKRESVEEIVTEDSMPMSEMLIKRDLLHGMTSRDQFSRRILLRLRMMQRNKLSRLLMV